MTWKSVETSRSSSQRPRRALVVERHERVVEDERRPPVAGHEPDEAQPRGEVDGVERALRQLAHRHPVVALGREHLDAEVRVVDPDALVAVAGHPGHVRDHALLEVARRALHRRLLGRVDLVERPGVDPLATPERGELVLPAGEPLGEAGDLLGVDRVLLHARPGRRLVVARPVERLLGVGDLDLEALAGPGLLGDRPEGLERRGLLLDLERRGVAAPGQRLQRLLPDEARQAGATRLDLGDVRLLLGEPGLGLLASSRGPSRDRRSSRSPVASRSSCSISDRPRSRRLTSASLSCVWTVSPRRSQKPTTASASPIAAIAPPMNSGDAAEVDDAGRSATKPASAMTIPTTTRTSAQRESGRQRTSGGTSKLTCTSPSSSAWSVADLAVHGAQPLDRRAEHGERRGRWVRPVELGDLVADDDGGPVALVALLRLGLLGVEPLGLARLLEHRPPLRERGLGLGPPLAGDGQRVAVPLEAAERVLARLELGRGIGHRVVRDLEAARVLRPLRLERVQRAVQLLAGAARAAVGAADRRLEAVPERALVALDLGQLLVADRGRRPIEVLGREARTARRAPRRRGRGR